MTGLEPAAFNPFPGLRAFQSSETHLFFGREGQSDDLLRRLARSRFLAVVGTSGSGKSSLVRAGLLPGLRGGFMADAGSKWRIAMQRPGHNPTARLAEALNTAEALGGGEIDFDTRQILLETTLKRSSLGLVEAARQARLQPHENLLIFVDQFEEIFRFKRTFQRGDEEAAGFVKLLLEASHQTEVSVYVVLTMRSDFLGDCAEFRDLPEALNEGQYLIPRMTRDQRRHAIEGPIAVSGAKITPRLVQRLLNDVGDDPDQLPILQHALMRTWEIWRERRRDSESIDLADYESTGGLSSALSRHADEAFEKLPDETSRRIAQKLFQRLSEKGPDNREIRHPTELREICAVADADEARVISVIDQFRSHGRTFLMPPAGESLSGESVIDISHESLIRLWIRLRDWVDEEAKSATIYRRLADAAVRHEAGQAALWRDPELQLALDWKERNRANEAWARRYHPAFKRAMDFLKQSQKDRTVTKRKRIAIIVGLCLLTAGLIVPVLIAWRNSERAELLGAIALARQLSAQADAVQDQQANQLEVSTLLAVESMLRFPMFESDQVLRQSLRLLTRAVASLQHEDVVSKVQFSPDGRYLATTSLNKTARLFEVPSGRELWRLAHKDAVLALAFSRDGREVCTGSMDGTARIFEAATGKETSALKHQGAVYDVAFSPDGERLATASGDGIARVFQVVTGSELSRISLGGAGRAVAFSPDGKHVAVASDATARLFEAASGREVARYSHRLSVHGLAFSPDGRYVASGSQDAIARVFEAASGREVSRLTHQEFVNAVAFAPSGRYVATASFDKTARVFDVLTGNELSRLPHQDEVKDVAFSPDGRYVATASLDGTARVFEAESGNETARLTHQDAVVSVAFSPDGRYVATASSDRTARIFEAASGQKGAPLSYRGSTRAVTFSLDGRNVTNATSDTVRVFDSATGRQESEFPHTNSIHAVALSPDGRFVVTASGDSIRMLQVDAGDKIWESVQSGPVLVVGFSPDGLHLAARIGERGVGVFESSNGKEITRLALGNLIDVLALSPNARYLAVGARSDRTGSVVDVATGKEVARLTPNLGVNTMTFSPNGNALVVGGIDRTVRVFEPVGGREVSRSIHQAEIRAVAFSPDGRYVAAGAADQTARVFEAVSGNEVSRIPHFGPVVAVTFTPDGRHLMTAAGDSEIVVNLHFLRPVDLIQEACSRLTRNLTRGEWKQYLGDNPYRKTCARLP